MEEDIAFAREHYPDLIQSREADISAARAVLAKLIDADSHVESLEAQLTSPGAATPELWHSWKSLIEMESGQKDPMRVKLAHERSLATCFLCPDAWSAYSNFLARTLKDRALRVDVGQRAVRNCPWDEEFWCELLRAHEDNFSPPEVMLKVFSEGCLQARLQRFAAVEFGLCMLQYARRSGSKEFFNDVLPTVLGTQEEGSPGWCSLRLMAAKIAAGWDLFDRVEELLELVLRKRGKEAFWWIEYAHILDRGGFESKARALYKRGTFVVAPEGEFQPLGAAWLDLESIQGTLTQYEDARERILAQTAVLAKRKRRVDHREHEGEKRIRSLPAVPDRTLNSDMQVEKPAAESTKRKQSKDQIKSTGKKVSGVENMESESSAQDSKRHVEANTVFVSNLPFSLTKEQLEDKFKGIEGFKEARFVPPKLTALSFSFFWAQVQPCADSLSLPSPLTTAQAHSAPKRCILWIWVRGIRRGDWSKRSSAAESERGDGTTNARKAIEAASDTRSG